MVGGRGCYLWDLDGRKYADYICGLGTNLVGYGHPAISRDLTDYLRVSNDRSGGLCLSLSSVEEVETAERLKELFPFIDTLKFLKTGTEACNAALRIARTYTGRVEVLTEGYHGWGDDFISLMPPACGVPPQKTTYKLTSIDDVTDKTAAVIVEPIMTAYTPERRSWLAALRARCTAKGAVLIFDEIITGFRFPKFSVSRHLGITPDLICLGKALGGGLPLSLVGGKKELMNDPRYFVSSTFAGEILSLVSCRAFLNQITHRRGMIDDLWASGEKWQSVFNSIWPENLQLEGYPTRGQFTGDEMAKALFYQESCRAGILFGPSWFYNFPLSDLIDSHLQTVKEILCKIRNGDVKLMGKMPVPPLAQMMRKP